MDANDARKTLASVQLARDHAKCGRHGAATALLMQVLQGVPQLADEMEGELTFSLKAYGEHLATIGQPDNALWLYSQAIPLLPRPRGLHTNLGALQYSLGKAAASMESFQRALALDPGYWPAVESLENVKSLAVDRWHFRMLNDAARNEAYRRAIERAVAHAASQRRNPEAGVTVLDIGTGTGILAVMAVRAGAAHVYACEVNGVLCDIAKEVLERNGVADHVTIIHKSSGALQPGVDIPEHGVDIVVTELVDSGLLGERIIPVLADARARGLLAEGGRVIPEGACVYAALLESQDVRRRSRLLPGSPVGLSTAAVHPTNEEPYTCEDLGRLDHQLLTSPTAVLDVDFLEAGAALLAQTVKSSSAQSALALFATRLSVTRSGRADAVAIWFDLWLDGERGPLDVVSTRPERRAHGDASGWDAGIYFASGEVLDDESEVELRASAHQDRLHFALNGQERFVTNSALSDGTRRDGATLSACTSTVERDSSAGGKQGPVFVGEMDLARLNDGHFHRSHARAVAQALAAQGMEIYVQPPFITGIASTSAGTLSSHKATPPAPAFVLDLCGAWGVAGILVAQLELQTGGGPATRVLAVAESEEAAAVLNSIARENGLGPNRYVATADRLVDLASRGRVVPAAWFEMAKTNSDGSARSDEAVDAIRDNLGADCNHKACEWPNRRSEVGWALVMASSLVEGSGLLKQGGLLDLELCREFVSDGDGNGVKHSVTFVPGRLEVFCQGLQRASLASENRVSSKVSCGVDVDPVNAFSVATFRELDLSAASPCWTGGSSATKAAAVAAARQGSAGLEDGSRQVISSSNGELYEGKEGDEEEETFLTAPVKSYEIDLAGVRAGSDGCLAKRLVSLRVERAGTLHAIAYWYRQSLGATTVVDTRPDITACGDDQECFSSSHFRQAAVLLQEPMAVKEGQDLGLCVFCNTSKGFVVQVLGLDEDVCT